RSSSDAGELDRSSWRASGDTGRGQERRAVPRRLRREGPSLASWSCHTARARSAVALELEPRARGGGPHSAEGHGEGPHVGGWGVRHGGPVLPSQEGRERLAVARPHRERRSWECQNKDTGGDRGTATADDHCR